MCLLIDAINKIMLYKELKELYYVFGKKSNIPSSLIGFLRKRREQKSDKFSPEQQEFIFLNFSSTLKALIFERQRHSKPQKAARERQGNEEIFHMGKDSTLSSHIH